MFVRIFCIALFGGLFFSHVGSAQKLREKKCLSENQYAESKRRSRWASSYKLEKKLNSPPTPIRSKSHLAIPKKILVQNCLRQVVQLYSPQVKTSTERKVVYGTPRRSERLKKRKFKFPPPLKHVQRCPNNLDQKRARSEELALSPFIKEVERLKSEEPKVTWGDLREAFLQNSHHLESAYTVFQLKSKQKVYVPNILLTRFDEDQVRRMRKGANPLFSKKTKEVYHIHHIWGAHSDLIFISETLHQKGGLHPTPPYTSGVDRKVFARRKNEIIKMTIESMLEFRNNTPFKGGGGTSKASNRFLEGIFSPGSPLVPRRLDFDEDSLSPGSPLVPRKFHFCEDPSSPTSPLLPRRLDFDRGEELNPEPRFLFS